MQNSYDSVVCVAFPMALPGVYDYAIGAQFANKIFPGVPVLVALRNRTLWGVAVKLKSQSQFPNLKQVLDIKNDRWTDSDSSLIQLYEWMASYYQCDLGKIFRPFIKKGMMAASDKKVTVYELSNNILVPDLTLKQAQAFEIVSLYKKEITRESCETDLNISAHMIDVLCKKGVLVKGQKTVFRQAREMSAAEDKAGYGEKILLTQEQRDAVSTMATAMQSQKPPFLLHGITGSGKTHVYIELVKQAMAAGKGAIVLVPEISLTPQTIYRFRQELGDGIAVIHSRMSEGERHDSLTDLISGKKRVVIGVRSAILVPVMHLGLIIVDEEHDGSYKQSDTDPRYNARDVAVMRGHFQKAAVVLGSATPSLESYYNAHIKKYNIITLQSRFGNAVLPQVSVVDMCKEQDEDNWKLLSRYLKERITVVLENKRQIILLLNRRGFSTFLVCKTCGHTYTCPACSVNLIFHKPENRLKCHQCGHEEDAPTTCAKCKGPQIKFKGMGIQKAEEYIQEQFPQARIIRMDQDTTKGKSGHIDIIDRFERREADILIGTQMVSKGLNFPGVALVGVLAADIGLHIPDFRASERTFQLLSQVAGRAGRNDADGEVVIQSYLPNEAAIIAAQNHDYISFYNTEIIERESLGYPPFGKLARFIAMGENEAVVSKLCDAICEKIYSRYKPGPSLTILGPAPATWAKLSNQFRYSILIKAKSARELGGILSFVRKEIKKPKDVYLTIDVDPLNML